jgi:hypothetical protein
MPNLILHAGGKAATIAEIAAVPLPEKTRTYTPVGHDVFVEHVKAQLPGFGFHVLTEEYGLAREGNQFFGVMRLGNGGSSADWALALGLRNSYDRSFALHMIGGSDVFVCDNRAFHGEIRAREIHSGNVFGRLPKIIADLIARAATMKGEIQRDFDLMKEAPLTDPQAHDLMVMAVRRGAIAGSTIQKVVDEWDEPGSGLVADEDDAAAVIALEQRRAEIAKAFADRNAWRLYNAFTAVAKQKSLGAQMADTLRLTALFRERFTLPRITQAEVIENLN